jgi:hypothetical protein
VTRLGKSLTFSIIMKMTNAEKYAEKVKFVQIWFWLCTFLLYISGGHWAFLHVHMCALM